MGNQIPNYPGAWQSSLASDPSKLAGQAEKVAEKAEKLASSALDRVQDARAQAESGLAEQRGQLTQRIRRIGDALRSTSDELRFEDEIVADYIEQAGDRVERLASYVSSVRMSDIGRDVTRFASERPAWFFGGTFLLGLAAGRFLKSTASESGTSYSGQPRTFAPSPTPLRSRDDDDLHFSAPAGLKPQSPMMGTMPSSTPGANGDKPSNYSTTPGVTPGSRTS